jgi:pSer/pThr/pTyr-binding forkhead associated (FHA) protein/S1-C subfamily serine protease
MRIELRILSGARAGQSEVFDQPTILIGRQPSNDLKFDIHDDIDVSGRHAEIRERSGRFYIIDNGSTNGTYLNGVPVRDSAIKDGDIIAFGHNGPTVEVRAKGESTGKIRAIPRTGQSKVTPAPQATMADPLRRSTTERVAAAVKEQTRGMKTMLIGSMIGLGTLAVAAYWFGHREASVQAAEIQSLLNQSDSVRRELKSRARHGDTSFANALTRHADSLRLRAQSTAANGSAAEIAALRKALEDTRAEQQGMAALDFRSISAKNDDAIAFLETRIDDTVYGGTAFGVTPSGLLVTNRHNVRSSTTGKMTTLLAIQYANTRTLLPATVVKVSNDSSDLALIQVKIPGTYPIVAGILRSGDAAVGMPAVTIGFPKSLELPQEGNFMKTTLAAGTVSKHITGSLLQLDTWGTHGLSGAPVFDLRGEVVGVVWGGPADSQARVVYAVPADRLVAFLGDVGKEIVR